MYPVNIKIRNRLCVIVGGGRVALRKMKGLLAEGARVRVVAPVMIPEIETLAEEYAVELIKKPYSKEVIEGAFLLFCATDDRAVNSRAAEDAEKLGILVNCADDLEKSCFTLPGNVRRGDLLITVSTGGASPELSRLLRKRLQEKYGAFWEEWLQRLKRLRQEAREKIPGSRNRGEFWREVLTEHILDLVESGRQEEAEEEIRNAIGCYRAEP